MTDPNAEFRPPLLRAKTLGRRLFEIYSIDGESAPAELLELLDIAESRLESAGYSADGASAPKPS
jgi:hypothetical protein